MTARLEPSLPPDALRGLDELAGRAPNAHFTQHPGWALVPHEDTPATTLLFALEREARTIAGALVRLRRAPLLGFSLADVFRGPMAESPAALDEALAELDRLLAPHRPVALRVDPYWSGPDAASVRERLTASGFLPMEDPPWPLRSLEIPIDLDAEALIASFKPATRRQVRKALRMELRILEAMDDAAIEAFHGLYRRMADTKGTSLHGRDFFRGIREFQRTWPSRGIFLSSWAEGELLGAITVFTLGRRAIYAYGASSLARPEIPKSHLLHFVAMQKARAMGCLRYDMGGFAMGIGEEGSRTATQKINYFKSGFGGNEVGFVGGHLKILRPVSWRALRALEGLRRRSGLAWPRGRTPSPAAEKCRL